MLRDATPRDLDALYEIEVACFGEHRFRKDHVDWILRNDRGLTLVDQDGKVVVGAAMLLFEGATCRVLSVAVVPSERRRGIGTRLMNAVLEVAERRGCGQIRLEVSTRNYAAIQFYHGLGYRTDGVLYGYYTWGEDAYSMVLPIPAHPTAPTGPERR